MRTGTKNDQEKTWCIMLTGHYLCTSIVCFWCVLVSKSIVNVVEYGWCFTIKRTLCMFFFLSYVMWTDCACVFSLFFLVSKWLQQYFYCDLFYLHMIKRIIHTLTVKTKKIWAKKEIETGNGEKKGANNQRECIALKL